MPPCAPMQVLFKVTQGTWCLSTDLQTPHLHSLITT